MTEINNKKRIQSQHFIYLQSYNLKKKHLANLEQHYLHFFYKSNTKTNLEQFRIASRHEKTI